MKHSSTYYLFVVVLFLLTGCSGAKYGYLNKIKVSSSQEEVLKRRAVSQPIVAGISPKLNRNTDVELVKPLVKHTPLVVQAKAKTESKPTRELKEPSVRKPAYAHQEAKTAKVLDGVGSSGLAIAGLVIGIIAVVTSSFILGIIAIVFGAISLGRRFARAALILGIIAVALALIRFGTIIR